MLLISSSLFLCSSSTFLLQELLSSKLAMSVCIFLLLEREVLNNLAQLRQEEVKGGSLGISVVGVREREKACSDCAG